MAFYLYLDEIIVRDSLRLAAVVRLSLSRQQEDIRSRKPLLASRSGCSMASGADWQVAVVGYLYICVRFLSVRTRSIWRLSKEK